MHLDSVHTQTGLKLVKRSHRSRLTGSLKYLAFAVCILLHIRLLQISLRHVYTEATVTFAYKYTQKLRSDVLSALHRQGSRIGTEITFCG